MAEHVRLVTTSERGRRAHGFKMEFGPTPHRGSRGYTTMLALYVLGSSTWVPLMGFWIHDLWCHRHGGEVDTHESGRSPSSVTVTVVVPDILTSRRTRFCFKEPPNRDTVDKESPYGCPSVMVKGIVYVIPA